MNEDFLLNDTLDNISFSITGKFTRSISKCEPNKIECINLNKDNVTDKIKSKDDRISENITFDDSVFLGDSFTLSSINSTTSKTYRTDSEDIFSESETALESFLLYDNNLVNSNLSNCESKKEHLSNRTNYSICTQILENTPEDDLHSNIIKLNDDIRLHDSTELICDKNNSTNQSELTKQERNAELKKEEYLSTTKSLLEHEESQHKTFEDHEKQMTPELQHNELNKLNNKNKDTGEETAINKADINKLSAWGLPDMILQKYESRNIKSMFSWQSECLSNVRLLKENKNLVYSAPTSAGKTLVAEILAIKTLLERKKKVLFILPFVSVVREKMFYFQDILSTSDIRVEGFMGSYNPPGGFHTVQVAICTIEKANSIVNRLLEAGSLSDIGAVVVDEMHLLGDPSRGYLLELLLTKLRYMSLRDENVNIQIIGMSATLPNLCLLAKWLDAELYTTSFRPIPLYELCHVHGEIYDNKLELQRKLSVLPDLEKDTDNILQLCLETIQNSCSVLIFCPTKNWCENLAQQIAMAFWKLGSSQSPLGESLRTQLNTDLITELLEQLKRCPVGLDKLLCKTTSFGVAFHHAGLTMDERDIIEGGFRSGALRVLVATSTLSAGVNLPARRVIIRSPMFHGKPILSLTYKQMIGRAGRMGKDTAGESILICQKNDYRIAKELMSAKLEPIESCLEGSGKLKRAILEVIASGVATSPEEVKLFTNCTLLAVNDSDNCLTDPIEDAMSFLIKNEFIRLQRTDDVSAKYVATSLAKACLSSSMPPEEGLALFTELEKARQCFVLETELHLIYLVTPYSVCNQWASIDWMFFLEMWEKLPASMKRVGELVGVKESFMVNATRSKIQSSTYKDYHRLQVHKRFYTALALQDLVNEVPLSTVAMKFNCSRGMLQSLQQSAATFAGMVTSFSKQLGWSSVEILVAQFQDRLQFGVNRDLLDLMRLPLLNALRARALYKNGIETLVHLASTDVCTIENILHKVMPFETGKEREGETEHETRQRNKIRTVWVTGKQGLTEREAAEMLIAHSREYLQLEMGLTDAQWGRNNDTMDSSKLALDEKGVTKECKSQHLLTYVQKKKLEVPEICVEAQQLKSQYSEDKNITVVQDDAVYLSGLKSESTQIRNLARLNTTPDIQSPCGNSLSTFIQPASKEENEKLEIPEIYVEARKLDSQYSEDNKMAVADNLKDLKTESTEIKNLTHLNESSDIRSPCDNSLSTFIEPAGEGEGRLANNPTINWSDESLFENSFGSEQKNSILESNIVVDQICTEGILKDINQPQATSKDSTKLGFELENSTFFERAFCSAFDIDTSAKARNSVTPKSNTSNDCIENSPTENNLENNSSLLNVHVLKYQTLSKKRPRLSCDVNSSSNDDSFCSEQTPKKKSKIMVKKIVKEGNKINKQKSVRKIDSTFIISQDRLHHNFVPHKPLQKVPVDLTKLEIINVCDNKNLFKSFCTEIQEQTEISLSIACIKLSMEKPIIGSHIISSEPVNPVKKENRDFAYGSRKVKGISITWGGNVVYYICFESSHISNMDKLNLLKTVLDKKTLKVKMFDCKEQIKLLKFGCEIDFYCTLEDPKVGDWLLEPEAKEKNLQAMVSKYSPAAISLTQLAGNCKGVGSVGLDLHSAIEPRIRSSVESVVTWQLVNSVQNAIAEQDMKLLHTYYIEMSTMLILAKMEIVGLGVDSQVLQNLTGMLIEQNLALERKAYELAGRHFSFASPTDVAKVLGMYKGKRISTNKQVLEQIKNPIADLIVKWRKINSILTKVVYPLLRIVENCRIHGCCISHTATGRISMHEPNLQNVPRDFPLANPVTNKSLTISCRSAFTASTHFTLLSADYCQLELRLLAHLSKDPLLCTIMKTDEDVFKSIAAKINNIEEDKVTEEIRQRAKQICYGIIYGMGLKVLAEQLDTTEEEAAQFLEAFHGKYTEIKKYIRQVINKCKEDGYIETIAGRRRYLPNINHTHVTTRGQAERQAVNTTIQGSAADIAKNAMVLIDNRLQEKFSVSSNKPRLILHLHDELLYEVPTKYVNLVAKIVKNSMENSVKLSIPFPVKLKSGRTWGSLREIIL